MSERDRDELTQILAEFGAYPRNAARVIIERGYRRTVTPEQIETAAQAIRDSYELDTLGPECSPATNVVDWLGEAKAAARAFGLVPEDGEQ